MLCSQKVSGSIILVLRSHPLEHFQVPSLRCPYTRDVGPPARWLLRLRCTAGVPYVLLLHFVIKTLKWNYKFNCNSNDYYYALRIINKNRRSRPDTMCVFIILVLRPRPLEHLQVASFCRPRTRVAVPRARRLLCLGC